MSNLNFVNFYFIMLIMIIGIFVGWNFRGHHDQWSSAVTLSAESTADNHSPQEDGLADEWGSINNIDKQTQSQVTYQRKNAQPRFRPLGQFDHGCW